MSAPTDHLEISLGPASLRLRPLETWVWQEPALAAPGPASLCLALLPLARPRWRGVSLASGATPPPGPAHLACLPAAALEALLPALCAPWLTPEEEADLLALQDYLRAQADYPGLDCAACRDQQARGEGAPDCGACPCPLPPASAQPALALSPLLEPGAPFPDWLAGLPPRRRRLLAMRLALIQRLRRAPGLPPRDAAC